MSIEGTTSKAGTGALEHKYNDDLLLQEDDQKRVQDDFPSVAHILDDPDLRATFGPIERRANEAKRHAQTAGLWAVIFAALALFGAASAPKWDEAEPWLRTTLALVSALMGVVAVLISWWGLLYGRRKEEWLQDRLRTEILRQFHFQTLIFRLDDIANSCGASEAQGVFRAKRRKWLGDLSEMLTSHADSKLTALLAPDGRREAWLHDVSSPEFPTNFDPTELFRAYRKLRFEAQLNYCNHKLRAQTASWQFGKMSLRQQARVISALWIFSFGGLALIHAGFVARVLTGAALPQGSWWHVIVLWAAFVAIGSRAIEHGFALPREIERYEDYGASVYELRRRFDEARTNKGKLKAMFEMEQLAFNELRNFLRAQHEARFVM